MGEQPVPLSLRVDVRACNGDVVVALAGELDVASAPGLRDQVDDAIGSSDGDLVVDLARLEFIDSSGVAALLDAYHRLEAQGRHLHVVNPGHQAETVFSITGLTEFFAGTDGSD